MKTIKSKFILVYFLLQGILFAQDNMYESQNIAPTNSAALNEEEFPQYSTEKYIYTITRKEKSRNEGIVADKLFPENTNKYVASDKISKHWFDVGITREKITFERTLQSILQTIETWTTKNATINWTNIALGTAAAGATAAAVVSAFGVINLDDITNALSTGTITLEQANGIVDKAKEITQDKMSEDSDVAQVFENKISQEALFDAIDADEINYGARDKNSHANIATGLTPEENKEFAPYAAAAGALALGSTGAAKTIAQKGLNAWKAGKTTHINPGMETFKANIAADPGATKTIAKRMAATSAGFGAIDSTIDASIAAHKGGSNDDIMQAAIKGVKHGVVAGALFGAGNATAGLAGYGRHTAFLSGVAASEIPSALPPISVSINN